MEIFAVALVFFTLFYGAFLLWCLHGWKKLNTTFVREENFKTFVSVVVPVRNEEKNISNCLLDILDQNYPEELVEVIISDDHSTDETTDKVRNIMKKFSNRKIRLISNALLPGTRYKKQAITAAIQSANGELVVTTDGDCRMSKNWLKCIVSHYELEHPDMIAGPVSFDKEKNFFERMQGLEFNGLVGIGAGSLSNLSPIMCNGGNLAYTKSIFQQVNGFDEARELVSGDDTQLMFKIAKRDPSRIHFLKSQDAVVRTFAVGSLNDFIQQRKRWASKIPLGMNPFTLAIAANAYLLHAGLLIYFISSLFQYSLFPIFILLLLSKSIPEFLLLNEVNSFFKKKSFLWLFLPAQFIYLFYISIIGAVSVFGTYTWKERTIKSTPVKLPVS